jgi:pyruvate/2-oxoacid:ferredoxin oxidoreductase alpha subunit
LLRLKGLWPFPSEAVHEALASIHRVIVLENNLGQILPEIERATAAETKTIFLPPETLATLHRPDYVLQQVMEAVK